MDHVEASLDLVDLEKNRIIQRFPQIIDNVRRDLGRRGIIDNKTLYGANRSLIKEIKKYLSEVYKIPMNNTAADRLMRIQTNLDLIYGLNNVLNNFASALTHAYEEKEVISSEEVLVESLHLLA